MGLPQEGQRNVKQVEQIPDTLLECVEQLVAELDREQGSGLISYRALVKLSHLKQMLETARGRPPQRLFLRDVVAVTSFGDELDDNPGGA